MEKKKSTKLVLGLVFGGLILIGVVVSILESMGVSWQKKPQTAPPETIDLTPGLDLEEIFPGEMRFIFYEDANANNQFDYQEKVFRNISVAVRRPGEVQPFIAVPANESGLVKITALPEGTYEVQYLNRELEQPLSAGDFMFKPYYEIIESGKSRFSFMPSEWLRIQLTAGGYKAKVGFREFRPKRVLAILDEQQLKFYDPERNRVIGYSQLKSGAATRFFLRQGLIYYLDNQTLKQFNLKDRVSITKQNQFYSAGADSLVLSPEGQAAVSRENEEWRWQSLAEAQCEGGIIDENYNRLRLAKGVQELRVDWLDENNLVVEAINFNDSKPKAVAVKCLGKNKYQTRAFDLGQVESLFYLNNETLFYSNRSGGFFYNMATGQPIKYSALDQAEKFKVSPDKKYISAEISEGLIVVDYPAVAQSGVEKHYLLPFKGQLSFNGDEVLINQAKDCQPDGDCGEVLRVSLQGNGVWELKERIELKDIKAVEVLGEIRL